MACVVSACGRPGVSAFKQTGAVVCPIHMRMGCPGGRRMAASKWDLEMNDAVKLRESMRLLWTTHYVETRMFITATVSKLFLADATLKALLQNQVDIGDAIAGLYGEETGSAVTQLLTEHIVIAGEIVKAAMTNAPIDALWARWITNAAKISRAISNLNPTTLPYDAIFELMEKHLNSTKAELLAYLGKTNGDAYERAVTEVYDCVLMLSDLLADGIARDQASREKTKPEEEDED